MTASAKLARLAGCWLLMALLCATAGGQPGQQKEDDRPWSMKVAAALDDPWPVIKIISKHGDSYVDLLGEHPLGKVPLAFYKTADFARKIGVAAEEKEDETLGASMILINADAALLKGMQAQGVDLNHDPKALAAKERLRGMVEGLDSGDQGSLAHLGGVVWKHLPYAMAEVGMNEAVKAGIEKFVKWVGPAMDKAVPIGDEVRSILGNRSGLASGLRYVGWRKLGTRANLAKKYTDELMHKMVQAALDDMVKEKLKEAFGESLDHLYDEVMAEHPSQVRRIVVSRPALYAPLVIQAMPAAALPAPVAALPAPAAVAARPAAAAPAPVVQVARDPVVRNIYVEDSYVRHQSRSYERESSRAEPPPPPPPPPEEPRRPTARELELHQELMCVGAGHKAGCGCWDGSRNCSLTGR